ncbi:MAG: histidine kinase [Robiginitomaculum sp.]
MNGANTDTRRDRARAARLSLAQPRPPEQGRNFPYWGRSVLIFLLAPLFLFIVIGRMENLSIPSDSATQLVGLSVMIPPKAPLMERGPLGYGQAYSVPGAPKAQIFGDISPLLPHYNRPAVFVTRVRRRVSADINGRPLLRVSSRHEDESYMLLQPHLFEIESNTLAALDGEEFEGLMPDMLTLNIESTQSQPFVARVYLGEIEDLRKAFRWRQIFSVSFMIAGAALALISALTSYSLALKVQDRILAISFALIMTCWCIICLWYAGVFSAFGLQISRTVYSSSTFFMIVASLNFANEWTYKWRIIRRVVVPGFTALLALAVIATYVFDHAVWLNLIVFADVIAAICVVLILVQIFGYVAQHKSASNVAGFVFVLCVFAVVIDVTVSGLPQVGKTLWPKTGMTLHYGPLFSILLGLSIIGGFVSSFLDTQKTLLDQLADKEREIAKVYALREDEVRAAALVEERKRIMRDMHDGIGGRLLALSLRAKRGRLTNEALTGELDDSMQELRLIIDSMDTEAGELDIALGALRGRIGPQLSDAGIKLIWDSHDLGEQPDYGAREVLSIYRMIQEAISNVIRHSGASEVTVSSRREGLRVLIEVTNNGGPQVLPDGVAGKGISNIKARANALGGQAQCLLPDCGGFRLLITLPARASN